MGSIYVARTCLCAYLKGAATRIQPMIILQELSLSILQVSSEFSLSLASSSKKGNMLSPVANIWFRAASVLCCNRGDVIIKLQGMAKGVADMYYHTAGKLEHKWSQI